MQATLPEARVTQPALTHPAPATISPRPFFFLFPDLVDAIAFDGALDGRNCWSPGLAERRRRRPRSFSDLQQRLNRQDRDGEAVARSSGLLSSAYDISAGRGVRPQGKNRSSRRRARLESFIAELESRRASMSPQLLPFSTWDELAALRADPPFRGDRRGVMIKRKLSPYAARPAQGASGTNGSADPRFLNRCGVLM